ncbi:elongation factor G [Chitinophaga silvatica]|uniref:Elongation factor G n=1 Tax=Chitinophaga silvatica TaxID=2282649 RepID=A0A3E1Y3U9_9BACT|nr:elongation factor G [Chitinophaga silvatica]RFS19167.1 elongation factor G [Chitinophaga silvatica]
MKQLTDFRNIGIMAHVDAGKTTLTERMLYFTGFTHKLGNVDDGNTIMDSDPQEEKRGITISSAAITTQWLANGRNWTINIIDTPGHVDFTAEVERSLRVLDGAVAVFDARSGVQPQTETVWHQANKYRVPRIAFVNKMDREGANFQQVVQNIRERLNGNAVAVQLPIGAESDFTGIIDLISMEGRIWEASDGKTWNTDSIPDQLRQEAQQARQQLLEELALVDEIFLEQYLRDAGNIAVSDIRAAIRRAVLSLALVPVLAGAAYKNKAVQPLLDAVVDYLPSPADIEVINAIQPDSNEAIELVPSLDRPSAALAFKVLVDDYVGQLTLVRVYSGQLKNGDVLWNSRTGKQVRVSRLMRILSDKFENVDAIGAGDIGAAIGLKDVKTGDTLADPKHPVLLEEINFPEPMIGYAIEAKSAKDNDKLGEALARLTEEDPTLQVSVNELTGQTILKGMGELHLEVKLEKLASQYQLEVNKGAPQIEYKEIFTDTVTHRETYKKQNGGSGSFADITFELSPGNNESNGLEFVNEIKGGAIPKEFIPSVSKGFEKAMLNGVLAGYPVASMKVRLLDGKVHEKDSHAFDFELAAISGFKNIAAKAQPRLLEPWMKVDVNLPEEYTGVVTGDLNKRRGVIRQMRMDGNMQYISAAVPLSELFGYITVLRTLSSGRASASMTFENYQPVPVQIAASVIS